MSRAVTKVCVFGSGVAAACAALAVRRAYGRLGVEVLWVEHGESAGEHEALIAPPDLMTFHRLLGIEEGALIARAGATINMGQQFAGWSGGDDAFLHAHGDAGTPFASLPFLQHWSRARRAGLNVALEDFSLTAASAKQGRFGQPKGDAVRQAVRHGLHLDAQGYASLLREACVAAGVTIVSGAGAEPVVENGRLTAVALPGGDTFEADLVIDADGALIAALDPHGLAEDVPPCDRLIRASAAQLDPLPLFSRVTAHDAGWLALIPLADRTAVEFAYASDRMTDEEAAALLSSLAGRPILAQTAPEQVRARSRRRPWVANCVAVGSAAGDPPRLDAAELLLLQLSIAQLILLWPLNVADMPEAGIYNEEMAGSQARVADFTATHFRLAGREGAFWNTARARPVSDILARKIALFEARGVIAHLNHEAHVDDSWMFCLTGHGLVPRSSDPQADGFEDQVLMSEFRRQLGAIAAEVRGMEMHKDALRRMKATKT